MIEESEFLDFLYIGAPRAGSSWLSLALTQHPEIWVPHNKEIHFFNDKSLFPQERKYEKGVQYYRQSFSKAPAGAKLGELSPFYYCDPKVAQRIYQHFPSTKIIVFLRNPIDVIFSMYLRLRNLYKREKSFEDEIKKYPEYMDLGLYYKNLSRYFEIFPKENILLFTYDDFFSNEKENLRKVYEFIGVDPGFVPDVIGRDINVTRVEYSPLKALFREQVIKTLNKRPFVFIKNIINYFEINTLEKKMLTKQSRHEIKKPTIDPDFRAFLINELIDDIENLERLMDKDLSDWKK
jgi:hypothetical protein